MSEGPVALFLLLFFLCLLLSAFFSAAEAGLLSVQRVRLQGLIQRRVRGARRVARMREHPERFLPIILLGNSLVNTAAAVLGSVLTLVFIASETWAAVVAIAGVTTLLLVFGEVIPKTVGVAHPERIALQTVRPLEAFRLLFFPLVVLLQGLSWGVRRLFGGGPWRQIEAEEELKIMISAGRASGEVAAREADLLERVFHLGDRLVREVMTPRTDAVWVEKGTLLKEFLELYGRYPYTRFPVYERSRDNVVGILSVKDVLRAMAQGRIGPGDDATALTRPPLFVPESKAVPELLEELQRSGSSMAVVVNEFGGVDGVATLTQLLEVMVGPVVQREGMPPEEEIRALDENTFLVNGGLRVEEVNQRLELSLPKGDYETIAGFILDALGHIPQEGEECPEAGLTLRVVRMRGVKIEQVQVTRLVPTPQAEME